MLKLRELRKEKQLTIAKAAECLNIPFETYRSYEIGRNQADYETLVKLADFFSVSVDYLLGRDEVTLADRLSGWEDSAMEKLSPIEYEMVQRFRDVGKKHGEQGQRALITVAEKML